MTQANADRSRKRTADDRDGGTDPERTGASSDGRAERESGGAALTSGPAAEAIERATAAVGSDEDETP